MYSLEAHGRMVAGRGRTNAYFQALEKSIKPNSIVADIGSGIGTFALFAANLGAKRVYAIESEDIIQLGREIAIHNDLAQCIEFIQARSADVTLPERADIIVSDLRGVLPLLRSHPGDIIDARRRLLATGGLLIPQSDVIYAAPVEAESFYDSLTIPWERAVTGIDGNACRHAAVNTWYRHSVRPEQMLAPAETWAVLDYGSLNTADLEGNCEWTAARDGNVHGVCFWFDATLLDEIRISNAPGETETVYGAAFFPLDTPTDVVAGDRISMFAQSRLISGDYVWTWKTRIFGAAKEAQKADFAQSTFFGTMLSLDYLGKIASDFRPELSARGGATKSVLELIGAGESPGAITAFLKNDFPGEFPDAAAALRFTERAIREYAMES